MSAASLAAAAEGDHVALLASGAWTVERAAELERLIEDASRTACRRALDRHRSRRPRAAGHLRRVADRAAEAILPQARLGRPHHRPFGDRPRADGGTADGQSGPLQKAPPRPTRSSSRSMPSAATSPRSAARSRWLCSFSVRWCWRRLARSRIRGGFVSPRSCIIWKRSAGARCRSLCSSHFHDRRHPGATGHFPFPHLRRRYVCRRHGRGAGVARNRRADRLRHGGRALRQRLYRRNRLDENARGDRHALRPTWPRSGSRCWCCWGSSRWCWRCRC